MWVKKLGFAIFVPTTDNKINDNNLIDTLFIFNLLNKSPYTTAVKIEGSIASLKSSYKKPKIDITFFNFTLLYKPSNEIFLK